MSLIYIKGNFKDATKTSTTPHLLPRITCAGITPGDRNLLALFSVTFSITHSHTPALCITSDTKAGEMEHINKVQSVPLLSLLQRGEKKLFIFIYQLLFFFSEALIFFSLFGGFLKAKQHSVTTIKLTGKNWQAEPTPLLCAGHNERVKCRKQTVEG